MSINNRFKNVRIEFHILQSFPVTCLNRDDNGAPKSAIVGGVPRARVSSQAWKRPVRLAMHDQGVTHGTRTKLISKLIANACLAKGATPEQAQACGDKLEGAFIKKKKDEANGKPKKVADMGDDEDLANDTSATKSDTLLFLSPNEVEILASAFEDAGFNPDMVITQKEQKKQGPEIAALIGKRAEAIDAVDIALFGRMVAQAATMNVEAAVSFSHAISTHRVNNDLDFFTAIDDDPSVVGSAHLGSLEFNSATYYRYVSLDVGQLCQTLAGHNLPEVVEQFVKALFITVPSARQATQSGASPWEFAKVLVRKGQRLQVPFETAIKATNDGGFSQPSIVAMSAYLAKQEKLYGSLFGKMAEYTLSMDAEFSIDDLIAALKIDVSGCA